MSGPGDLHPRLLAGGDYAFPVPRALSAIFQPPLSIPALEAVMAALALSQRQEQTEREQVERDEAETAEAARRSAEDERAWTLVAPQRMATDPDHPEWSVTPGVGSELPP